MLDVPKSCKSKTIHRLSMMSSLHLSHASSYNRQYTNDVLASEWIVCRWHQWRPRYTCHTASSYNRQYSNDVLASEWIVCRWHQWRPRYTCHMPAPTTAKPWHFIGRPRVPERSGSVGSYWVRSQVQSQFLGSGSCHWKPWSSWQTVD